MAELASAELAALEPVLDLLVVVLVELGLAFALASESKFVAVLELGLVSALELKLGLASALELKLEPASVPELELKLAAVIELEPSSALALALLLDLELWLVRLDH